MTYKQLEALYPIIRDVIWDVPETVGKLRASGAKKFGIEVQQAGLQRILFEFAKLGFETCEIIETEVNHAENEYINRYVLILRDVSQDNSRLIEATRVFDDEGGDNEG
jgi:hypothetical protein